MKKGKKALTLLLIFTLALSLFPQSAQAAKKKKVKLSKKTVTVKIGKTVKLKLKNNKKKVKWTVISGKKNVTLSKKKKTGVTIKGKRAGTAKVQAKVGKKKYVCKVTVKKKKSAKKTVKKVQTIQTTPTPKPTKAPVQTMQPVDQTPAPTPNMAELYGGTEDVLISSVKFDKDVDRYALQQNTIYVLTADGGTGKESLPDVKKCQFTVYSHGKKAEVKSISDPVWEEKYYYGDKTAPGHYTFNITVVQDGKQYTAPAKMIAYTDSIRYFKTDNGLLFRTLIADGKEYKLESSIDWKKGSLVRNYYFKSEDVSQDDLAATETYKAVVLYQDKEYTVDCQLNGSSIWTGKGLEFGHTTLKIGDLWIGTLEDSCIIKEKNDTSFSILTHSSLKGNVNYDPNNEAFEYQETLAGGKSLKDIFTDLAKDLQIRQAACNNQIYTNAAIDNVVWHDESYYDSGSDGGYYSFDISLTVKGETITQHYLLVEKEKKYTVSGVMKMEDGTPITNIYLRTYKSGKYYDAVYTNDKGEYSLEASDGTYDLGMGQTITVNGSALKQDVTFPVYFISGSIVREGAPAANVGYQLEPDGDNAVLYFETDEVNEEHYRAYLEAGSYQLKKGRLQLDTLEVNGSGTKDFTIKLYKVTGQCEKSALEFVNTEEDKNSVTAFPYNGFYAVYLKPGTYNVLYQDIVIDTVEITSGDLEKDIKMTICKGKILNVDKKKLPYLKYFNYMIDIKKDGEEFKSIRLGSSYSPNANGTYEIALPKGEYEFSWKGKSLGSVTIADEDVETDLILPLKYIKMRVLDKQNNVILPNSNIGFTKTDSGTYSQYSPKDKEGVLVELGDYEVNNIDGLFNASSQGAKFSVDKDTDLVEIKSDVYRVSGSCQIAGENGSSYKVTVFDDSCVESENAENGMYELFLSPGEYTIECFFVDENKKEHPFVRETLTVPDAPLTKNFEVKCGSLSGQLTWKDGTSDMYSESELWLYPLDSEVVGINADLGADGSFSFTHVPYGTYKLKLDETELETITINSPQKKEDYTINGYRIAATVKDADGNFVKNQWVYFSSGGKDFHAYVDNDKGLALGIVDEPGEYEVYAYTANSTKISYGTVTVKDKNVTCNLSEIQ